MFKLIELHKKTDGSVAVCTIEYFADNNRTWDILSAQGFDKQRPQQEKRDEKIEMYYRVHEVAILEKSYDQGRAYSLTAGAIKKINAAIEEIEQPVQMTFGEWCDLALDY